MRSAVHASGGLKAPDPNRPFQSRPIPSSPQAKADTTRTQVDASQQSGDVRERPTVQVQQAGQRLSNAAATGSQTSRAQTGSGSRVPTTGGCAGVGLAQREGQATPQGRVLAKLGLSNGGQLSKAGQQASKASTAQPSTAAPSGGLLQMG